MPVIEAQAVSKRFLLRHNASVELKVRFLGLLHPGEAAVDRGVLGAQETSRCASSAAKRSAWSAATGRARARFLKLIAGIHRPTSGRLLVARGARICSMIELGVGFHPELTGRENVFLSASIHGLSRAEIDRIYQAVVEYSGLEHFIDVPIKNYSSGMYMRLGFAIAANLDPDILLLDEIFAVGDADFQQRCIATVNSFMAQRQDDHLRLACAVRDPLDLPARVRARAGRTGLRRGRRGRASVLRGAAGRFAILMRERIEKVSPRGSRRRSRQGITRRLPGVVSTAPGPAPTITGHRE